MKVLCIAKPTCCLWCILNADIKIGEVYEAIGDWLDDETYYLLEHDPSHGYAKEYFIPISDQDNLQLTEEEAEDIRQRQSKPVNI